MKVIRKVAGDPATSLAEPLITCDEMKVGDVVKELFDEALPKKKKTKGKG